MSDAARIREGHNEMVLVELYDALFQGRDELAALLKLIGHGPGYAIEAGCGTGRVLVPLAEGGWRVCGFDVSERMLELATRKIERAVSDGRVNRNQIELVRHDMRQTWPGKNADIALVALNTILMCKGIDEIGETLRSAGAAVRDGGPLILSIVRIAHGVEGVVYEHGVRVSESRVFMMRSSFRRKAPGPGIVRTYYVDELEDSGVKRSHIAQWEGTDISGHDLRRLTESCGFVLSRSEAGYCGDRFEW